MRGGASKPHVKVFGTWFDLNDTTKIQPIEQDEGCGVEVVGPASDDDDDSWAHLEVGSGELAASHPPYSQLATQDVCVMAAAFASDFELTSQDAVGWRGQVSDLSLGSVLLTPSLTHVSHDNNNMYMHVWLHSA